MKTQNSFDINGTKVSVKILDVTLVNGEKPKNPAVLVEREWDTKDLPVELADGEAIKTLAAYGFASLIQDRCSQYTDKLLGESCATTQAVAEARLGAYQDVYDLLLGGAFTARRVGGGKQAAVDVFFATGFMNFLQDNGKAVDVATATAILQGMNDEQRKALRADARIAPKIEEARKAAREAASGFDLDALLG